MNKEYIAYEHQGTQLEGYLVVPHTKELLPGIILCHAWRGRDNFVCKKAEELAEWGYTTFALDVYGKGVLGTSKEENEQLMEPFMLNRIFLQQRLLAGVKAFQNTGKVDKRKISSLGFCFGGLCALDLARCSSELIGAISVHGLLQAPEGTPQQNIKAKVLALHGFEDPMVPPDQVEGFEKEMTRKGADWQLHVYGNTMHAFTNPDARDPSFGTVYNPVSAKRAWIIIRNFLNEIVLA